MDLLLSIDPGNRESDYTQACGGPAVRCYSQYLIDIRGIPLLYRPQLPDDSRNLAILQLETLSGVARGLTRTTDGLLAVLDDDDSSPQARAEAARIEHAREDGRMVRMRAEVFAAISSVVEIWSGDAGVGHVGFFFIHSVSGVED